ncbi:hypothetical protein [Herbidospora yilanensis]|uniref:hypothetical protein n=1 Tax=Herbidospora yilanensis TaxID=354426 RepID=UPI000AF80981|nr:hypothetical protein [Herbidospora yilanensis]
MAGDAERHGWDQAAAGLIAVCAITELEFFHSARSIADRGIDDLRQVFGWTPVDDRAYDRAWKIQEELTRRGQHRSAGPVDPVVAATAEIQGGHHRSAPPVVRPSDR